MIKHKLRKLESEAEVERLGNIGDDVGDMGNVLASEDTVEMMDTEQREFQSDASVDEKQSSGEEEVPYIVSAGLVNFLYCYSRGTGDHIDDTRLEFLASGS